MASRQKLRDFFEKYSYAVPEQRIGITIDPADTGPADRFNHGDDLGIDPATGQELVGLQPVETTGGLIGDFLKYIVEISDNAYKIDGGNTLAVSLNSRAGNAGKGVPLEPADQQGATNVFIDGSASDRNTLGSVMAQYSSGYFHTKDDPAALQKIISKDNTIPDLGGKHAQEMLSNIEGGDLDKYGGTFSSQDPDKDPESAILNTAQQILVERSRFNPSYNTTQRKAFAPKPTRPNDFESGKDDSGTTTSQNEFGNYDTSAVKMIQDNLKSAGASLLLKSAGWDKESEPGSSPDPDTLASTLSIDGVVRPNSVASMSDEIVNKISPSVLRSKGAHGAPSLDGISTRDGRGAWGALVGDEDTDSSKSFGSITTPYNQFSSEDNNDVLIALAAASIAAMVKLTKDTWDLIEKFGAGSVDLGRGPYYKGESTRIMQNAKFSLLRNVVLVPTKNPYGECVDRGFLVLFNVSDKTDPVTKHIVNYQQVEEAPGFWLGVARKIIRGFTSIGNDGQGLLQKFESESAMSGGMSSILSAIRTSDIINIMNVAATIGDVSLTSAPGWISGPLPAVGQWNVDRLPDGPATRISKSRSQTGLTSNSLAWRNNSVPALYMIPRNVIMASAKLGTLGSGQNPLKGMMASELVKHTYVDPSAEGSDARIPNDIVESMENTLDAEYVPFYFHDLRTNEIVSFHAFLETLSDSYAPEYTPTRGYGRIDPVKIYRSTTRTIRFSFYVAATSKEDFNDMWWKINKLTSLVYPQWTKGTKMVTTSGDNESTFVMPFSQVLASSPVIRLRVGDVIKSNYSNFNLARMFGIGDSDVSPAVDSGAITSNVFGKIAKWDKAKTEALKYQIENVFGGLFGSPLSLGKKAQGSLKPTEVRMLRSFTSQLLVNGFANPLGVGVMMRELQDPDSRLNAVPLSNTVAGVIQAGAANLKGQSPDIVGYTPLSFPLLRPSVGDGYISDEDGKLSGTRWRITRPIRVLVMGREVEDVPPLGVKNAQSDSTFKGPRQLGAQKQKTLYKIMIVDFNAPAKIFGRIFHVTHADLMPNPDALFGRNVLPSLSIVATAETIVQALVDEGSTLTGLPTDTLDVTMSDDAAFMNAENNPIVRAFESASGRGLAGVITSLSYNWIDSNTTWEIDWNSRAPKVAKVDVNFDVIHDLPPGLDYSGYNRAPLYNVGDTMQSIAGDPYNDDGRASHDSFKNQGRLAAQSNDPEADS